MAVGKIFAISFAINAIMGGSFKAVVGQSSNAMQQLREKTTQLNAAQKRLKNTWDESQKEVKIYQNQLTSLRTQLDAGKISQTQYDLAVKRVNESMRSAGMSIEGYKNHMARLRQEAAATQAKLEQFNRATIARNQAAANFSAAKMGLYNTATTIAMLGAPVVSMIETAATFEASMSKVQAITRANGDEIQKLTDNARKLGETTQFSATQAAEAMSYLGMAGWNTEQIMAGMPGLLALAAAGGTDLARTADIVSDDLTAFGLSAEHASHMADVFAVTATRCNTNVEMIGETMKYAAPVARGYGATMEETAALTGLMANAGVKASQAGTSLRAGFLRLAGPPKKASKALDELGISLSDATKEQQEAQNALKELGIDMDNYSGGPAHKMVAIISDLRDATAQMGKEQKLAALSAIFGTNAATGWLNVLEAGPEVFESLVNEMENCDGEAEKMAGVMMNNAKGAFIQLKSAIEGLSISVGNIFLPTLTAAARGATSFTSSLSVFVKEHEGLTAAIISVGAALVGTFAAFKTGKFFLAIWQYASTEIELFKLSLMSLKGAALETAAGQRALAFATGLQTRAMTLLRAATSGDTYRRLGQSAMETYTQLRAITWAQIGQGIKTGIGNGVTSTKTAFNSLKANAIAAMSQTRQTVVSAASNIATQAGNAGRAVMNMARNFSIAGALQAATNGFKALGTAIMGIGRASLAAMFSPLGIAIMAIAGAAYLIYSNWELVGPFFMGLWAQIQAAFVNAGAMIQPAIAKLQEAFSIMISSVGPAFANIGNTVMGAFNQICAAFSDNSGVLGMIGDALLFIAEILGGVLVTAFVVSSNIAVGCLTALINVAAAVISGIIGFLTGVIQFITGVFTGNWTMAWEGITNIFSNAFNTLKNIASGVLGGIETMLNGIVNSIKGVASLLPGIGGGGGNEIPSNARGGIYRKGAFLTTFAEDGPEAAIPLDGSPRAIGLWRKAGEILGIGGGANTSNGSPAETLRLGSFAPHPAQYVEQPAAMNAPPISITLHFNGDHEPNEIRKAVEKAGQTVQRTFMEQMEQYNRERGRLSYEQ